MSYHGTQLRRRYLLPGYPADLISTTGLTSTGTEQVVMSKFLAKRTYRCVSGLASLLCASATLGATAATPPDFSPNPSVSWVSGRGGLMPPSSGAGPVSADPEHPTITNDDFRTSGKQPTFPVADLSNPILQPWVREVLRKRKEQILYQTSN
jgi:hypothetical protein